MKSIVKYDFFDKETFKQIQDFVFSQVKDPANMDYSEEFTRYYKILLLPEEIKSLLLDRARKETNEESLEVIYSQIVLYQIKGKNIPQLGGHKDLVTGEWVMDVAIDSTLDWPLIIEDQSFSNPVNSVFFLAGDHDFHLRPAWPSTDEKDYLLLLFVHLAKKDTQYYRVAEQVFSLGEESLALFLKSSKPYWVKYDRR